MPHQNSIDPYHISTSLLLLLKDHSIQRSSLSKQMIDTNLTHFHKEKNSYQSDKATENSITLLIRPKKKPHKIVFLSRYLPFAATNKPPSTKKTTTESTQNSTNIKLEMSIFIPARSSWFPASLTSKRSLERSIRSITINATNKTMSLRREDQLMNQFWTEEDKSQGKKMPKGMRATPFPQSDKIWWR